MKKIFYFNQNKMIEVIYTEIPDYLKTSEFYKNLDPSDTSKLTISFMKSFSENISEKDLEDLLKTLQFWNQQDKINISPKSNLFLFIFNNFQKCKKIYENYGGKINNCLNDFFTNEIENAINEKTKETCKKLAEIILENYDIDNEKVTKKSKNDNYYDKINIIDNKYYYNYF